MKHTLTFICILFFTNSAMLAAEDDSPVKVGAIFSLSGWGDEGGQAELNGTTMAIDAINAAGGIHGRPVELIVEDNQSDLGRTVSTFKKLTAVDRVPALIGPNWSEFIDVVAPLAAADKVPVVTATGYKEKHLKKDPWVFVLWPPPSVATNLLARRILKQGHNMVSVFITENAYYEGLLEALRKQLEGKGVVLRVSSFSPDETDYRTAIAKISRSDSTAIIALLLENAGFSAFLRQRLVQRLELPLFSANALPFDDVVRNNLELAEGMVYFDYVTAGTADFTARYKERFDKMPGFGSAKAYDGMQLIARAMENCGILNQQIRACLKEAELNGASGRIEFSELGVIKDDAPNTRLFKVENATIVPLESGEGLEH